MLTNMGPYTKNMGDVKKGYCVRVCLRHKTDLMGEQCVG
jgi:hypothetical protein